jgi:hypothetical protein
MFATRPNRLMLFSETNQTTAMPTPCGHSAHLLNLTADRAYTVPRPLCNLEVSQSVMTHTIPNSLWYFETSRAVQSYPVQVTHRTAPYSSLLVSVQHFKFQWPEMLRSVPYLALLQKQGQICRHGGMLETETEWERERRLTSCKSSVQVKHCNF